jgi:hypothetical protein
VNIDVGILPLRHFQVFIAPCRFFFGKLCVSLLLEAAVWRNGNVLKANMLAAKKA